MDELKTELLAELKAKGIEIAEDALVDLVKIIFPFLTKLVIQTENKFDDLLVAVFPIIEKELLVQIDKIDGKEG